MLPELFIKLLILAVPQLAPYAVLLRVAPGVIAAVVSEAERIGDLVQAIHKKAPQLWPAIVELTNNTDSPNYKTTAQMLTGHRDMTIAEHDFWTDNMNRNRG